MIYANTMTEKLRILATLLLLSSTVFSQTATNNCKISLSYDVASRVAVDLVRGDSVLSELKETQEILRLTQSEVQQCGEIVYIQGEKELNYQEQIGMYQLKEIKYKDIVKGLEQDNRKLNLKIKVFGYGVFTLASGAIMLGILTH